MSDRALRVVAWALLAMAVGCLTGVVALAASTAYDLDVSESPMLVVCASFAAVGALVAAGAPRNPIGWLMLAIGTGLALFGLCTALVDLETARPGTVAAAPWIAWLSVNLGFVWLLAIPVLLQRFPSGALPSPRWRRANTVTVAAYAAWSTVSFAPGPLEEHPRFDNPIGLEGFGAVIDALQAVAVFLFFAMLVVSVASVVHRLRRAEGMERLQIKWVAFAICLTIACWLVAFVTSYDDSQSVMWVIWSLSLCAVPVSIGVAVRRYRLYEIDRVISRTLVYGSLTVVLGGGYAGLVLVGQGLFASFAGGSNLAIAASTLVVAALFLPVRGWIQGFVDRRFYRRRYDAQRTLEAFGARLREQIELDNLQGELVAVVGETMQPVHAALWLRSEVAP